MLIGTDYIWLYIIQEYISNSKTVQTDSKKIVNSDERLNILYRLIMTVEAWNVETLPILAMKNDAIAGLNILQILGENIIAICWKSTF